MGRSMVVLHPDVLYGAAEIRAGRFPLWNPHVFGGVPFFANPQTALLFPLTALAYVLPPAVALTLLSVFKLSAAGAGLYEFLRRLDFGRVPAVVEARASAVLAYREEWMLHFPLPPRTAIALLMPNFFGSPLSRDFWGPTNFNEFSLSVGVVPWLALPAALVAAWSRPGTKYFAGLAVGSAALVYGAPLVGDTLARLPVLSTTLIVRTADLLVFALPVLGALGLDAVRRAEPAARRLLPAAVRGAFAVLSLAALPFVWREWALPPPAARPLPLWSPHPLLLLPLSPPS